MKFSDIASLEFSDFGKLYSWISDNRSVNVFRFKVENSNSSIFCGMVKIEDNSDNLLVLFNGAVDREKHDYETYQRWSWIEQIPHNVLIIPDITLAQGKFALGWGVQGVQMLGLCPIHQTSSKPLSNICHWMLRRLYCMVHPQGAFRLSNAASCFKKHW